MDGRTMAMGMERLGRAGERYRPTSGGSARAARAHTVQAQFGRGRGRQMRVAGAQLRNQAEMRTVERSTGFSGAMESMQSRGPPTPSPVLNAWYRPRTVPVPRR